MSFMTRCAGHAVAVIGLLLGACLRPDIRDCAEVGRPGILCPYTLECAPREPELCGGTDEIRAGEGKHDAARCASENVADGACRGGVCLPCLGAQGEQLDLAGCEYIGWLPMTSGTGNGLNAVWAIDYTTAYAVGDGGVFLEYDGKLWRDRSSELEGMTGENGNLTAVWGTRRDNLYVVSDRRVLHFDGQWSIATTASEALVAIWGASDHDVFAVGDLGMIVRFDGARWSETQAPVAAPLNAVWGTGPSDVVAVGNAGTIVRFDGLTWTAIRLPAPLDTAWLRGVWGTGSTYHAVGTTASDPPRMMFAQFDGAVWTTGAPPAALAAIIPTGVWGTAADDVFVTGEDGSILHHDGRTWAPMDTLAPDGTALARPPLLGVRGVDARHVLAVGHGGTILRYTGASWSSVKSGTGWNAAWDGINFNGVSGKASDDVVVVGSSCTVLRFGPDRTWSDLQANCASATFLVQDVWVASDGDVYAVSGSEVLRRSPGTLMWSPCVNVGAPLQDISPAGAGLFAAGAGVFAAPGWIPVISRMQSGQVHGLWGTSPDRLHLACADGLRVYAEGTIEHALPDADLAGVWGATAADVFAVGAGGAIVHFDGDEWRPQTGPSQAALHAVWGTSPRDVFAVGDDATVLHYGLGPRGGLAWERIPAPTRADLTSVWGMRSSIYIAGGSGTILRLLRSPRAER